MMSLSPHGILAPAGCKRDLLSIRDLDREELEFLVSRAEHFEAKPTLKGKQVALLFYENSTRTYNSFRTAVHSLGGLTCGFAGVQGTSVLKGESLYDTIKMFQEYADAIVLRHPKDGAARWAAEVSKVPVINAGDGRNQHPTQTLLDLLAIQKTQGRLEDLEVVVVGDLKYGRTVRSLCAALSRFPGNRVTLVSPPSLRLPDYLVAELTRAGLHISESGEFESFLGKADILYMTRIQEERIDPSEFAQVKGAYRLRASHLRGVKSNFRVLHPLPRVDEIAREVDDSEHAYYFEQAKGGVAIRAALLQHLLGSAE